MEGMNGIEFAKEILCLKGNNIVIVMITAFSLQDIEDKEEIRSLVDRVITKPFSLRNLDSILSSHLANQTLT